MNSVPKKIERMIYNKINYLILQILELAQEEGLCVKDEWGMRTLAGVRLDYLVEASVALMQNEEKEELKFRFSSMSVVDQASALRLEKEIKGIVKEILLVNFIRVSKTEYDSETKYAEIVGYDVPDKESSISYFFALLVFNLSFHRKENEDTEELLKKPFNAFVISVIGRNMQKETVEISKWVEKAERFVEKMLKENYQEYRLALIQVREIATNLEYINMEG